LGGRLRLRLSHQESLQDLNITFNQVDASALWKTFSRYLPDPLQQYTVDSGRVSGHLACTPSTLCRFDLEISDFNLTGSNAAEDVRLDIKGEYQARNASLNALFVLREGAVYFEPGFTYNDTTPGFLVAVEDKPIQIAMDLDLPQVDRPMRIRHASVSHPNVVSMTFDGDLIFGERISWQDLNLIIDSFEIKNLYEIYIQPVIFGTTVDSLELTGRMSVSLHGQDSEITDLKLTIEEAYFDDALERFALYGLNGDFVLTSASSTETSSVTWQGASIYGITLGNGKIDWDSWERNVRIAAWDTVSVFDGQLDINELLVSDFGTRDASVVLSGGVSAVSMPEVMASFGLPPLAGKVSATLPRLSFQRNNLAIDGDIEIDVFNGEIHLRDMNIASMFSSVPRLFVNIEAIGLDLATLTSTFSFGNISGTLDGYVKELRLEAWQPLSFDAHFATRENDIVRHRISRQAVDNLGRIGAQTSVLSSGWLKFIPNYSYGDLGLGCRLERGYCQMSGVSEDEQGFYVLTQGGLLPPWINIKGQGRLVSWQTLIDGIKQISTGEVAVELGTDIPESVQ
ncbi:MAG: hypothetical protein AAF387_13895, partial [Pseudomonadota bacterium]